MKKTYLRIALTASLLTGAVGLQSCRDYLELQPVSGYGIDQVFSDVSTATSAIIGVYDVLSGDPTYGIRLSMYYPYDSDEMMCSGALDNGRRGIARYNASSGNSEILAPWTSLYQGIERANICIKNVPQMAQYTNGTDAEKKLVQRLHGEALTLRAQFYHELIRNWGDVPAPMTPSVAGQDFNLSKANRDSVYDGLLNDLKLAATLVPWRTEAATRDERITKGAVKALRARLALARGGYSLRRETKTMERRADYLKYYQIARDECAEIMQRRDQHALSPDYFALFKGMAELRVDNTGEIMFEVANAGGSALSDSKLGYYNGPRLDPSSRFGQGGGGVNALPTYFYAFDSLDTRRDVTITIYQVGATNLLTPQRLSTITDGKFRRDWRVPVLPGASQYLGFNWPIIRFSDVLLMFAETEAELSGVTPAAVAAFEEVRKRGYRGNATRIGVTPTDKAGFFTAVVNERLLEFGGEGVRKYDLIRWNLLKTRLDETRATLTLLKNGTGIYATYPRYIYYRNVGENVIYHSSFTKAGPATTPTGWTRVDWRQNISDAYIASVGQFFTPGKTELLPIPQTVIDADPNLKQDYGY